MLGRLKFELDALVQEMLSYIPEEMFTRSDTTFLDPAMGGGQFVYQIENRLRKNGHSDENISQRVFGFESNRMRVNFAVNKNNLVGTYAKGGLEEMGEKKFDVIVGNPPFNSSDTQRLDTNHRGQGENLSKKFINMSLDMSENSCILIAPYSRLDTPGYRKYMEERGLYRIKNVGEHFKDIGLAIASFYFNRTKISNNIENEFDTKLKIPSKTFESVYECQPGRLNRQDYEKDLTDSGKYQIVVTTSVVKYTDDSDLVLRMKDRTVGYWRVVMNSSTSPKNIGKLIVVGPDSILSKSVNCLKFQNQYEAEQVKKYLEEPHVNDTLKKVKVTASNSIKFLKYIENPFL